jgi:4'-phosphopantetheinyl transferase
VGIDVEKIRPEAATDDIAARFFSEQEVKELSMIPDEARTEGFFRCWTRKEAYIKARGKGLQIPLRSFSVSVKGDESPDLTDEDGSSWRVYSLQPAPGFAGALVTERRVWRIRYWEWQRRES